MKLIREQNPVVGGTRYRVEFHKCDSKYGNGIVAFEDMEQLERFSEKLRQLVEGEQRQTEHSTDKSLPCNATEEFDYLQTAGDSALLLVFKALNLYSLHQSEYGMMDLEAREKTLEEMGLQ